MILTLYQGYTIRALTLTLEKLIEKLPNCIISVLAQDFTEEIPWTSNREKFPLSVLQVVGFLI